MPEQFDFRNPWRIPKPLRGMELHERVAAIDELEGKDHPSEVDEVLIGILRAVGRAEEVQSDLECCREVGCHGTFDEDIERDMDRVVPIDFSNPPGQRELFLQQIVLNAMRVNFEAANDKLRTGIVFSQIERRLADSPEAIINRIKFLMDRGGQPTVTTQQNDGRFRVDELAEKSLHVNGDLSWYGAIALAKRWGVRIMDRKVYEGLSKAGIALDRNSQCHLKPTPSYHYYGKKGKGYYYSIEEQVECGGLRYSFTF